MCFSPVINSYFPPKEQFDEQVINSAFKKIVETKTDDMEIHFVYAGDYDHTNDFQLKSFLLKGMKKHNIKMVMVTTISITRQQLITKEKMENYYKREQWAEESVNDDLESLFEDLQFCSEPKNHVQTFLIPKLTSEELKLVERTDSTYFETFCFRCSRDADVPENEMNASESDSKFLFAFGFRKTYTVENPLLK